MGTRTERQPKSRGAQAAGSWVVEGLVLVAALGLSLGAFYQYRFFYHDDAFISLRYWDNFARGQGLVWNPGERVEGYTNFLFLVITGLLSRSGLSLPAASRLLGVISFLALNGFVLLYRKRVSPSGPGVDLRLLPTVLTLTSFPLIIWSLGGLETVFFAFLCTAAVVFCSAMEKNRGWAGVAGAAFALAAMTRPDALLLLALALLFGCVRQTVTRSGMWAHLLEMSAWFLLVYGPYFIWRVHYYGDLLPNTFYVKGEFGWHKLESGLTYLGEYSLAPPYVLLWLCLGLVTTLWTRRMNWQLAYFTVTVAGYVAYVVYVGGDHMPGFRFLAPILPTVFLLVSGLSRLDRRLTPREIAAGYGLVVVLTALQFQIPQRAFSEARRMDRAAFVGRIIGEAISEQWPAGSLVALNTGGSTPFFAPQHRFIDMLGLNDRHIAKRPAQARTFRWKGIPGHEKGDGNYVLGRRPDYIILGPSKGATADSPWFLSDLELSENPEFHRSYECRRVWIDLSGTDGYALYDDLAAGRLRFTYYRRKP